MKVGIDVGGTFTDFLITEGDGSSRVAKVLSTPEDPSIGLLAGLTEVAAERGETIEEFAQKIDTIVHGTTVTTKPARATLRPGASAVVTIRVRARVLPAAPGALSGVVRGVAGPTTRVRIAWVAAVPVTKKPTVSRVALTTRAFEPSDPSAHSAKRKLEDHRETAERSAGQPSSQRD